MLQATTPKIRSLAVPQTRPIGKTALLNEPRLSRPSWLTIKGELHDSSRVVPLLTNDRRLYAGLAFSLMFVVALLSQFAAVIATHREPLLLHL